MNSEYAGGGLNTGGRDNVRNGLLAGGLVIAVAACGFGGMLIGRAIQHHEPSDPRPDSASVQASPPVPRVTVPAGRTDLRATTSIAVAPPITPTANAPTETPGQITEDKEIGLALERWRKALLTNDSDQIAPSYAAHVNRYFLKTQVSRAYVRDYMERDEESGTRLTKYDLQGVSIRRNKPNEVEVTFQANFAVSTPTTDRTGHPRTTLMMRMEDGDWKIFYERDFKT